MRKFAFICAAAALLTTTPAIAQPCIVGDLFGERYDTEGQCNAALNRKRNEIREYYKMRGHEAADFNSDINEFFTCVQDSDGWRVDFR